MILIVAKPLAITAVSRNCEFCGKFTFAFPPASAIVTLVSTTTTIVILPLLLSPPYSYHPAWVNNSLGYM